MPGRSRDQAPRYSPSVGAERRAGNPLPRHSQCQASDAAAAVRLLLTPVEFLDESALRSAWGLSGTRDRSEDIQNRAAELCLVLFDVLRVNHENENAQLEGALDPIEQVFVRLKPLLLAVALRSVAAL
jgi:hypothetical protein